MATLSLLDNLEPPNDYFDPVSALFSKRFLKRPFGIASIVPSSKALVERVGSKMDFSRPRVIAEYGPGEGVHSRGIARRMTLDSHLSCLGSTRPSLIISNGNLPETDAEVVIDTAESHPKRLRRKSSYV